MTIYKSKAAKGLVASGLTCADPRILQYHDLLDFVAKITNISLLTFANTTLVLFATAAMLLCILLSALVTIVLISKVGISVS